MAEYHDYYDLIHHGKKYSEEIDLVLKAYREHVTTLFLGRVLDVGCGTGNHSLELAKTAAVVWGIDTDPLMIQKARQKAAKGDCTVKFACIPVEDLLEFRFDLVTALFYVVNYIKTLPELIAFVNAIYRRLGSRGAFIFDAWNGTVALMDPARKEERLVEVPTEDGKTAIAINIIPDTQDECTHLNYQYQVTESLERGGGGQFSFGYQIAMRLWTLRTLREVMKMAGFSSVKFYQEGSLKIEAFSDTWKIMGVCIK